MALRIRWLCAQTGLVASTSVLASLFNADVESESHAQVITKLPVSQIDLHVAAVGVQERPTFHAAFGLEEIGAGAQELGASGGHVFAPRWLPAW